MALPVFSGIGQNTSTNQAAAPVGDFLNFCGAPTIVAHPGGSTNIYPAIDQTRGLIVMDQVVPADFGINNNAMSSAVVMDEAGNVLATREQFFFFNTFLSIGANNL